MADEPVVTPATPEVVQGNAEAARTGTGEIKDQQGTQPQGIADPKTPESKPDTKAETKPAEGDKKPDPAAVPEKYDLKPPEGKELDPKLIEEITPLFKEMKLTNEQAQKLTDFYNKTVLGAADNAYEAYEDMRTANRDTIIKDPTLGNGTDGMKPEVTKNIAEVMSRIGDKATITAFKEAMDLTGAGDHPAFVKAFNTLGKLLAEGSAVKAGGPAAVVAPGAAPKSPAQALYPNLQSSAQ